MRLPSLLLAASLCLAPLSMAHGACCYFAALGKDINQPGQKAFLTWDEAQHEETFTVQPTFTGNATDFGMVIPTTHRPRLNEMPRDFFKALAIFTILEPMDLTKYKRKLYRSFSGSFGVPKAGARTERQAVRVLEAGIVGSLDYKILEADEADALFTWLQENHYSYAGDRDTLDYYVQKKWDFTVMKIDPRQMKRNADGSYTGEITPTRFKFASDTLEYPLHITQLSVPTSTDALFYVLAPEKVDLAGDWSYEPNFLSMWSQALSYALPDKITPQEHEWQTVVDKMRPQPTASGGTLEWSSRLTDQQMQFVLSPDSYDRVAPKDEVEKLSLLKGYLQPGMYLTKFRKQFNKAEMTHDLDIVPARVLGLHEDLDYTRILPTSPP